MKCFFCKAHVNEKRQTTVYAFVSRKNGTMKKVRWCKPCDESKAEQIDQFLRESNDVPTGSETS
jgi:hypothetical protein